MSNPSPTASESSPSGSAPPALTPGCLLFIVMGVWFALLGGWMTWRMTGQVREMRTFTDSAPRAIAPAQPDAERVQALRARVTEFGNAVEQGAAAKLELDADELNDLLASQEPVNRLKDMMRVEEITDVVKLRVSLALNGIPFTGERLYFNGILTVRPDLRQDVGLVLLTRDLQADGKTVTEGFRNRYLEANHVDGLVFDEVRKNAAWKNILSKISAVRLENGKVILEFAPPAQAQTPAEPR